MKNCYQILNIDPDADIIEIRLSFIWRIKKIAEIFVILSDDKNRRNYNFFLEYLKSVNSKAIFDNSLNYEELLKNNTEYDEYSDEENYKTYYEILGVDQDASESEIYNAFKEKVNEIGDAYRTLSKKEERKKYDLSLEYSQISTPKKFMLYHYLVIIIIGISVVGYIIWRLYHLFT